MTREELEAEVARLRRLNEDLSAQLWRAIQRLQRVREAVWKAEN